MKSVLKAASRVVDVEIQVPLPPDAGSPKFNACGGVVKFCAAKHALTWQLKRLEGNHDLTLTIAFSLPAHRQISLITKENSPHVDVRFTIPGFLASKLQARFLKVIEKSGYHHTQCIRYLTIGEKCQHRLSY